MSIVLLTLLGAVSGISQGLAKRAKSFEITAVSIGAEEQLQLRLQGEAGAYYILQRGPSPTELDNPVRLKLGEDGQMLLPATQGVDSASHSFFRIQKVSTDDSLDVDADEIPDVYELRHASVLDPLNASDAENDPDNDGQSNLMEFRMGTSPTDSSPSTRPLETQLRLDAPHRPATGDSPRSVAAGDLDGDGRLDLATANERSDDVSVLLAQGDGEFSNEQRFDAGTRPWEVAIGDVNGDETPDLVVANSGDGVQNATVSVLAGRGDGSFEPHQTFEVGSNPNDLALGDLNADGRLDVAVANADSDFLSILTGTQDGLLAQQRQAAMGTPQSSVDVGDADGDGNLDIVVAESNTERVAILTRQADGSWSSSSSVQAGMDSKVVRVEDVNQDSVLDLIAANTGNDEVILFLGQGDGKFTEHSRYEVTNGPASIATGDMDLNGIPDLLVGTKHTSNVAVFLGKVSGGFARQPRFDVGATPVSLAIGDLTGDGLPEAMTANLDGDNVSIAKGHGTGRFSTKSRLPVGNLPRAMAADDLDGDQVLDLVVANEESGDLSLLAGTGTGTFLAENVHPIGTSSDRPLDVALADLNDDGHPDIVATLHSLFEERHAVVVLQSEGGTNYVQQSPVNVGKMPVALRTGDVNGDGQADVVTVNSDSADVSVLLGQGDGSLAAEQRFQVGNDPGSIALADVDGDGNPDIVTANSNNPILLGSGDGSFAPPGNADTLPVLTAGTVRVTDLNGDGHADLIDCRDFLNDIQIFLGKGSLTFEQPTVLSTGNTPESLEVGDVNGDDHQDIVTANSEDADVSIFLGNGDGTFSQERRFETGSGPVAVALGDFDGTHALDIAVANQWSDDVSILKRRPITIAETPSGVWDTMRQYNNEMAEMFKAGSTTEEVFNWIRNRPEVVEAGRGPRMIHYRLRNGTPAYVYNPPELQKALQNQADGAGSSYQMRQSLSPQHIVNSDPEGSGLSPERKKALILSPFEKYFRDTLEEALAGTESEFVYRILDDTRGYNAGTQFDAGDVRLITNQDAGPKQFTGWNEYDVVHVSTHGGISRYTGSDGITRLNTVVATGKQVTKTIKDNDKAPMTIPGYGTYVALTGDFFMDQSLKRTVVFFSGCQTLRLQSGYVPSIHRVIDPVDAAVPNLMPLLAGHSSVYLGWSDSVLDDAALQVAETVYQKAGNQGLPISTVIKRNPVTAPAVGGSTADLIMARRGDHKLRIRECVRLLNPVTGKELDRGQKMPVKGVMDDGENDRLPVYVELSGVEEDDKDDYQVTIEIDGNKQGIVSFASAKNVEQTGDYTYKLRDTVDLDFDVTQNQLIRIGATTPLPEGGNTQHKYGKQSDFKKKLKVQLHNPEFHMTSYVRSVQKDLWMESNVSSTIRLKFKRVENEGNDLVFEGEGPKTLKFGRHETSEDGILSIPSVCIDNDRQAAVETVGEVVFPIQGDTYGKESLGEPGEWIFAGDGCDGDGDPITGPLIVMWGLEMWALHTLHDDARPPKSTVQGRTAMPLDQLDFIFTIQDWDSLTKKVYDRSVTIDKINYTEMTTLEFVFPEGN